jgi:hypothetical protein
LEKARHKISCAPAAEKLIGESAARVHCRRESIAFFSKVALHVGASGKFARRKALIRAKRVDLGKATRIKVPRSNSLATDACRLPKVIGKIMAQERGAGDLYESI